MKRGKAAQLCRGSVRGRALFKKLLPGATGSLSTLSITSQHAAVEIKQRRLPPPQEKGQLKGSGFLPAEESR